MNKVREKILLLLIGGLAFGYSITPGRQTRVLRLIAKEWKRIDKKELREGINYLYRLGFIDKGENKKGTFMIFPTRKGRLKMLNNKLDNIKNTKEKWDGKWRMVAFDIPEKFKNGRDVLRRRLRQIGFCELQKSVLITPYNCEKEIGELVNLFELGKYVRFGVLDFVDNEKYLKSFFKLN